MEALGGGLFLMSEVPLYPFMLHPLAESATTAGACAVGNSYFQRHGHLIGSMKTRPRHAPPCTWGADVIRKEAWSFYRIISGVRLCWELEEPKGPKERCRGCAGCPVRLCSVFSDGVSERVWEHNPV